MHASCSRQREVDSEVVGWAAWYGNQDRWEEAEKLQVQMIETFKHCHWANHYTSSQILIFTAMINQTTTGQTIRVKIEVDQGQHINPADHYLARLHPYMQTDVYGNFARQTLTT